MRVFDSEGREVEFGVGFRIFCEIEVMLLSFHYPVTSENLGDRLYIKYRSDMNCDNKLHLQFSSKLDFRFALDLLAEMHGLRIREIKEAVDMGFWAYEFIERDC